MALERYGWGPFFQQQAGPQRRLRAGRVRLATARRAHVFAADRKVSVSLPRNVGPAAVGDWLLFEPRRRIARQVLLRRNALARARPGRLASRQILAANVDTAFILAGLDRELRLRPIERYLACALAADAEPVIVLNKADMCTDPAAEAAIVRRAEPRFPVVVTSATEGRGISEVEALLQPGRTAALAGPSGVGKSSLVNALVRSELLEVGAVRAQDRRGRHTTTRRELVLHPRGYLLMDIPGIRELLPWSSPEAVRRVFPEIARLGVDCRYRDCTHRAEPECSVRGAVRDGIVDADRLASFVQLLDEQHDLERAVKERSRGPHRP